MWQKMSDVNSLIFYKILRFLDVKKKKKTKYVFFFFFKCCGFEVHILYFLQILEQTFIFFFFRCFFLEKMAHTEQTRSDFISYIIVRYSWHFFFHPIRNLIFDLNVTLFVTKFFHDGDFFATLFFSTLSPTYYSTKT